jgi:hypothetical protein
MRILKTYFRTIFKTLTDPDYYNDVAKQKGGFSFKYFFAFYLMLSILVAGFISFSVLPQTKDFIEDGFDQALEFYPNEMELTLNLEEGRLSSSGIEEPFVIPIPYDPPAKQASNLDNILVIDTGAEESSIIDYRSALLLTERFLVVRSDEISSSYQVIPYTEALPQIKKLETEHGDISQLVINKEFLAAQEPMVENFANQLIKIAPWFIFLTVLIWYPISRLVYLLVMTILTFALANMFGRKLKYGQMYKVGLHTVTIADGVTKLQFLLYPIILPGLFTLAFLGTTLIAIFAIKKK